MIYEFKNIVTGKIFEYDIRMSEYDSFILLHPELERYIGSPPGVTFDSKSAVSRQPEGFKEVLAKIGENHPISPLAERYRKNKTIKEIKTKQVVDKHRKKSLNAAKARQK